MGSAKLTAGLALGILFGCAAADAQPPSRVARIGLLTARGVGPASLVYDRRERPAGGRRWTITGEPSPEDCDDVDSGL